MKNVLVTALVLFLAANLQAQKFNLGVKAGVNFSDISSASHLQLKEKTGFIAGGFVSVGFNKFAIQPEVLYSQQGSKVDLDKFDLDYLNVPVILKYYLIGDVFNLQVGPQFGFLMNDKITVGDQIKAKDFDMSGVVGAGLDLPAGFRLDARYHFGIQDISPSVGKNQVVSLALGFTLF